MSAYGRMAEVYDELMADMPYDEWVRFTLQGWQRYGHPKTIVELGCGTGNITYRLADRGVQVVGIDLSPDMLAVAESKQVPGKAVRFVQQDMREWEIGEPVDGVVCYCDGLNYLLEEADLVRTFAQTYKALRNDGLFLFDMHSPYQLRCYAEQQPFILDEPHLSYIWTSELDEERSEIEHHLTFFVQESPGSRLYRRFEETHTQRAYDPDWIISALHQTGFAEVRITADFSWNTTPDERSERLFFVAVKRT